VVTAQIVSRVLDNQRMLAERGGRLANVQRAMQVLQRDLLQISPRGVRDVLGDPLPAVVIDADGLLELTRLGWRNPLAQQRAELQRVTYLLEDGDLYRVYWPVLDRAPDSTPLRQQLLDDVELLEFVAIDTAGNEHTFWPQEAGETSLDPNLRLAAVLMRIEVQPFGLVERLWPIPGA
jgi:general secretion pathway protein J